MALAIIDRAVTQHGNKNRKTSEAGRQQEQLCGWSAAFVDSKKTREDTQLD